MTNKEIDNIIDQVTEELQKGIRTLFYQKTQAKYTNTDVALLWVKQTAAVIRTRLVQRNGQ